jgi:hypothetical protein
MLLPFHNARLLKVERPGTEENHSQAAEAGDTKWEGSVPAHVVEEPTEVQDAAGLQQLVKTHVTVPGNLPVDFALEDVVTLQPGGERKVQMFVSQPAVGTTRLYLYAG